MTASISMNVRIRLSLMMFMQYLYFAVFFVPLAAYIGNIGVEGALLATIMSSMPLGSLMSPIICMIADRHFASQKVLAVLNVICAILLFVAAKTTAPVGLFIVLLIAMFCYMPTWSLTNAIALAHYPPEKFPQIRSLGSIGWVSSGLFGLIALKIFNTTIDGTAIPLICGAVTALVAAVLNLTLPHTPPPAKGQKASWIDALGLPALKLMKDRDFCIFMILSMLMMTPFVTYFSFGSAFFQDKGFKLVTVTMNWGQLVEMFLMLLVPLALAKFGIKWTMVLGLAGMVLRYLAFWGGSVNDLTLLYYVAIFTHGLIFGFFIVGGQVYIDKKAPKEMRAQAQGLMGLLCFGVGWLAGNYINGFLLKHYKVIDDAGVAVTDWQTIWKIITFASIILMIAFAVLFRGVSTETKAEATATA